MSKIISRKEIKEYCPEKNHNNISNIYSEWSMGKSSKKYQKFEMRDSSKYKIILQFPAEKDSNSIQIETDIKNIMADELKRFFNNNML